MAVDAPPLLEDARAEVCVVGLGGAGLAALRHLHERGVDAIGIDAGSIGGGASGRNGGFLLGGAARFHHDVVRQVGRDRAVGIYRATLDELDRIVSAHPRLVRRTGSLRIAASDEELADCVNHRDALIADGITVADYDGPEGRGLLLPDDAAFDPRTTCRTEAARLVEAGARFHERTPATGIGTGSVRTASAEIRCDAVIVAVDGGLEGLLPELEGRVRTARAQMVGTAPVDEPLFPRPVYRRWGYDYHQQLPDGRIVIGGFRDRGGEDEWGAPPVAAEPVQTLLERHLREELEIEAEITHRWAGAIAFTEDGLPILEEVRGGVLACGAYSGTGNLIGRLAGRAAAELVVDRRSALAGMLAG